MVFLDERNPPFLTVDVASKVALSMTPVMVTLAPWTIVVPVPAEAFSPERTPALRSAPAIRTLPVETPFASTLPTARLPPADTLDRRLVRLVCAVVLLVFLVRAAEDADAASSAEVMLTPPVPMSVALPPAAMSDPVMARVLPALTLKFPPLVRVVPLNVSVLVFEDEKFFLPVRAEVLVVSVVVTPVMLTLRPAESEASPPAETRAASRVKSRPALTTRLPV